MDDFDAAVLCGGATKPRDLPVEGRQLQGVHFAVDFLTANTRNLLGSSLTDENPLVISARGKDVIVIGGGDTGTDCVGTSLRHGCRSVTQFEILERPPLTRQADNPWPEWPKVLKTDYGQEEAASITGEDPRHYCIQTKRIEGDENGRVKAIHTIQIEWVRGANGRFAPREIPGTEKVWPAELVLLAMGFTQPQTNTFVEQLGLETEKNRFGIGIKADAQYRTSKPNWFAAGDARRGQSLVVWAISEGREAARQIDIHLMGFSNLRGRDTEGYDALAPEYLHV